VQDISSAYKDTIKLNSPVDAPAITEHSAEEAFEYVLASTGAVLPARDALDNRIVHEALNGTATYGGAYGTGRGIIDTQTTVGGWPTLNSTTAPVDTDHDGMPDDWEDARGLNKNDAADRNGDLNGNGYTNLEDYLNSLVEAFEYIVRPIHLAVDTVIGVSEVKLSWEDISDNETGFSIERNDGSGWTEVASPGADETSYTDNAVPSHGVYYYRIKAFNDQLESFYTDSVQANVVASGIFNMDRQAASLSIYPNPFVNQTRITYTLTEPSPVDLALLDLAGREVMPLVKERQPAGEYSYTLTDHELTGGIYLIRLNSGKSISMARVIVAR